jgi:uncharacterized protein (DUF697 family)
MFERAKRWFSREHRAAQLRERLGQLRQRTAVPVFWLFGKTQSGKTSIIKYLTGADAAEIGLGFRPCTRFSREYQFPTPEAPLLIFLDTRGVDEPGYDPAEDLARFNSQAHVIVVTVKALDHAQERMLGHLRTIRRARPHRPVVLALTCLHEAYPQQQHPQPYPFAAQAAAPVGLEGNGEASRTRAKGGTGPAADEPARIPPDLARTLAEQRRRFEGLVDVVVPLDLTRPEEGFEDPDYGGERLKQVLLESLPGAYRQTLLTLDEATRGLRELYAGQVLPHIAGYSTLAATAGAIPLPWVDLLILPGIQTQMIYHLARLYGQPLSATRFLELAGTLGLGVLVRQATRELVKFIPYVGSVAGGALAGASTFALGKAFCYYYSAVHQGHVPRPEELRRYYHEQLALAEYFWKRKAKTK